MKHAPEQTFRSVAVTLAIVGFCASEAIALGNLARNPATHPTTLCALTYSVSGVLTLPDGKIVIGSGNSIFFFSEDSGTIGKLNGTVAQFFPDGSLDCSFSCRANPPVCGESTTPLVRIPDGRLLIIGYFETVDDEPRHRLAFLLPNGKLDKSFVPWRDSTNDQNAPIRSPIGPCRVALDEKGQMSVYWMRAGRLIRLDESGRVITNLPIGQDPLRYPWSAASQLMSADGVWRNRLVEWHQREKTEWSLRPPKVRYPWKFFSAGPPLSAGDAADILEATFTEMPLELYRDGIRLPDGSAILVLPEKQGRRIRRFDKNWHVDLTYTNSLQPQSSVSLALQKDGKLLVACGSGVLDLTTGRTPAMARLNTDGSIDRSFSLEVDGQVVCLAAQDDGKILIGGSFLNVNGVTAPYFARLKQDGSLDQSFQSHFTNYRALLAKQRVRVKRLPTIASSSGTPLTPSTLPVVGMTNVVETIPKTALISILITSLEIKDGAAVMQFEGAPNTYYILQAQNALGSIDWFNISTNQTDADGKGELRDPNAEDSAIRFYRVAAP